jgi:hypothetical protein
MLGKRWDMPLYYLNASHKTEIQNRNAALIDSRPRDELYDAMIVALSQLEPMLETSGAPNRMCVGYALGAYQKKWQIAEVSMLMDNERQRYIGIDPYADIERQIPSDVTLSGFVHKIHEVEFDTNPLRHEAWERLRTFEKNHPEIAFVDPVSISDISMSRKAFLDIMGPFDRTEVAGVTFRFPSFVTYKSD